MSGLVLDHLAVSAMTLDEGVAAVQEALGVPLGGGGSHPHMSTHNRLLGLGDLYLEVIAADPAAPKPAWPRWFDLDNFQGQPRLTNWIVRCDDLEAAIAKAPQGVGVRTSLQRGDYRWQMAIPADGKLPFDGAWPALIHWQGDLHPTRALADNGLRLRRLEIAHPQAEALAAALEGQFRDPRVVLVTGPAKSFAAEFSTPAGPKVLQ